MARECCQESHAVQPWSEILLSSAEMEVFESRRCVFGLMATVVLWYLGLG